LSGRIHGEMIDAALDAGRRVHLHLPKWGRRRCASARIADDRAGDSGDQHQQTQPVHRPWMYGRTRSLASGPTATLKPTW
jgi:hypothetical protein